MSLVGTRPPTVDEWDKYELHHRARLATKPGLTGMWQVSGRSNITDLQLAVIADEKILQERLSERDVLTRFEKENQSKRELDFMEKGVRELGKHNIDIMNIYNNDNLDENVEKVISYIADRWRKV